MKKVLEIAPFLFYKYYMKHIKLFEDFNDTDVENWEDVDISDAFEKKLVVYNDDVNSFDHVIESFMNILGHKLQQAEQLATIIHHKGKAVVKNGTVEELEKYLNLLTEAQLSCKIED